MKTLAKLDSVSTALSRYELQLQGLQEDYGISCFLPMNSTKKRHILRKSAQYEITPRKEALSSIAVICVNRVSPFSPSLPKYKQLQSLPSVRGLLHLRLDHYHNRQHVSNIRTRRLCCLIFPHETKEGGQ